MKDTITHSGIIERIEGTKVTVKIVQHSACHECKAKSMCSSSESKEKLVEVFDARATDRRVGDEVIVCGALSMGKTAVRLAFMYPLVIIITWLLLSIGLLKMTEPFACLLLLFILGVYFMILHHFREKLSKKFAFWIE